MRTLLIIHALLGPATAVALTCDPLRRPPDSAEREVVARVIKAGVKGDADRRTPKDFARETFQTEADVVRRYAATGDVHCASLFGQGQVVLKNNVVVTVAHMLYPAKDCSKPRINLDACKFTVVVEGQKIDYKFKEVVSTGYKCPGKANLAHNDNVKNDWIILRLTEAVDPRVKPYNVDAKDAANLYKGRRMVVVAKSNDYNPTQAKTMRDAERHYGSCGISDIVGGDKPTEIQTDCDITANASGGSVMNESPRLPNLIGMIQGEWDPTKPGCARKKIVTNNAGPYVRYCWGTTVVPIAGDLKSELDKIAAEGAPVGGTDL